MLDTIVLEVRDRGTLIPVMATRIRTNPLFHSNKHQPAGLQATKSPTLGTCEAFLLKRAGWSDDTIMVTVLEGHDKNGKELRTYSNQSTHDIQINEQGRTLPVALEYIMDPNHFQQLFLDQRQQVPTDDAYNLSNSTSIGVVDVEFILGETQTKKKSDMYR